MDKMDKNNSKSNCRGQSGSQNQQSQQNQSQNNRGQNNSQNQK